MNFTSLELKLLRIPFKIAFKHASAERNETQAVLVIARSTDGIVGYGEGCPRDYVTGENEASVTRFFKQHYEDLESTVTDLSSLLAWCDRHEPEIDNNPAAWCAIELALLDLFSKQNNQPVEALLGLSPVAGPFVYSAVIGAMGAKQFSHTLGRYQKLGMRDYKIKLAGDVRQDSKNIAVLHNANIESTRVRVDANNLWSDPDVARDYLLAFDFPFFAIEEPLRSGSFEELALLSNALDTRIVLDESVTRKSQLAQLPGSAQQWIVNLRVSKMGGLLRSLNVVWQCRENGLAMIVGAQVGETSLLTRAALIVAQAARDILIAQEGAFGTLLLESDAMQPTLMFGANGELDIASLRLAQSPGFGLTPVSGIERYLQQV